MIGGADRHRRSQRPLSTGPRRSASNPHTTNGSQIHGSRKSAPPASVKTGPSGLKRPSARAPWNRNETQPCRAFQIRTGVNTARAAEYLEDSARPAQMPPPSHQPQAARPSLDNAAIRQRVAPSNAANSGPSGKTQVPAVTPMTGHKFASTAAHNPAHAPNSAAVSRYISHVVNANNVMKGRRTMIGLSLPRRCAAAHASHQAIGG